MLLLKSRFGHCFDFRFGSDLGLSRLGRGRVLSVRFVGNDPPVEARISSIEGSADAAALAMGLQLRAGHPACYNANSGSRPTFILAGQSASGTATAIGSSPTA